MPAVFIVFSLREICGPRKVEIDVRVGEILREKMARGIQGDRVKATEEWRDKSKPRNGGAWLKSETS